MSKNMKGRGNAKANRDEQQMISRLYKNVKNTKVIYERWVSNSEGTLSTSAGGVLALSTMANTATINASPDFASLATLYTAYRCKAVRVTWKPFYPVPVYNGAAVITVPSLIAVFPWTSNNVPTTLAQAQDVTGVKFSSGYEGGFIQTSYRGDPDAHLWTGTGSAIGSNEQFGISCIGTATASTASTVVWKIVPEYLVEFRMVG